MIHDESYLFAMVMWADILISAVQGIKSCFSHLRRGWLDNSSRLDSRCLVSEASHILSEQDIAKLSIIQLHERLILWLKNQSSEKLTR